MMTAEILANEKYMNDAISSILSNLVQASQRKKERSIWDPIPTLDLPKLLAPRKKGFNQDPVETESSILPRRNVCDKDNFKRKFAIATSNNKDEDKHISVSSLHNQQVSQNNLSTSNCGKNTQHVEDLKLYGHQYENLDIRSTLGNDLSNTSILFTKMKLNDEDTNFDDQEFELVSSKFSCMITKNVQENVNPINSNRKQVHTINRTDVKGQFENWCETRQKEHVSRFSINQSNAAILMARITDMKKDIDTKKLATNKNEHCHLNSNVFIPVSKQISSISNVVKGEEIESAETCGTVCQDVSKIAEKISSNYISQNSSHSFVEISNNKSRMEQRHNNNPEIHAVKKVVYMGAKIALNTETSLKQTEDRNSHDFVTEVGRKKGLKNGQNHEKKFNYNCNQNRALEPSSSFINDKDEIRNVRPKEPPVLKKFHSKNKSFDEDSKKVKFTNKREKSSVYNSSENVSCGRNDLCSSAKYKIHLCCIKIADEKCDRNFEITVYYKDILPVKKLFPNLSAEIPNVDAESKEMNYSAEAMNIILRFVFHPNKRIVMPACKPAIVGPEVLAAAQSFNMSNFFKLFQKEFLENVLTKKNASVIFSHAYNYNLKEVCDACKNISQDGTVLNTTVPRRKKKNCLVSILTYVEPLAIFIPFEPIEKDLSFSFPRQIQNKFTFKVISGCYSITGFGIHLNENLINEGNEKKVMIDYSIESANDNQEINICGRVEKNLGRLMCINFKKNFIIEPKQVRNIIIETEIEPYLCSAFKEKEILIQKSVGKLELSMESNMKVQNSDRSFFLVGEFFYHVTEVSKKVQHH